MDAFDKEVKDLLNCPNFQKGSFWAKTYHHPLHLHQPPALPFFSADRPLRDPRGWTQPVSEIKFQASTLWVDEKEPGGSNWTSSNGKTYSKDICATWITANLSHTQKPRKAPGKAVAELVATYPASQLLLIRQRHTGVPAPKLMLWGFPAVEQKVSTSHNCLLGMLYHHVIGSTSRWWWRSHFLRAEDLSSWKQSADYSDFRHWQLRQSNKNWVLD